MSTPNHVAGGIVFTGIFGSISGVNILTSEWYLAFTVFSSIFPDIDHPSSILGKIFYPISKWINRHHGHRTLTHSYIFIAVTTFIIGYIESLFSDNSAFTLIYFFAMNSHLLFDQMTVMGVAVFYPFSNATAVVPGDDSLRFVTSNRKTESLIFGFFMTCIIFLIPLFESGFWTSYNRTFGTLRHCYSEFTKSDDLLEIEYRYRIGSESFEGFGYLVESSYDAATLLKDGEWLNLDNTKMIIERVTPTHTGIKWKIEQTNFVGISTDSINSLFYDVPILRTEVHANNNFNFWLKGKQESGKVLKSAYLHQPKILEINETFDKENVLFQNSPRIKTIERQIYTLTNNYQLDLNDYSSYESNKKMLKDELLATTDLYRKEDLTRRIKNLKPIDKPVLDKDKLDFLKATIKEIRANDLQLYEMRVHESNENFKANLPDKTQFTGYIKFVTMERKPITQK